MMLVTEPNEVGIMLEKSTMPNILDMEGKFLAITGIQEEVH